MWDMLRVAVLLVPWQSGVCPPALAERFRQISGQNLRPLGQAFRACRVGNARVLGLLHEAPDLFHFRLLVPIQSPSPDRIQAGSGLGEALIDGGTVLFLFLGRKDIAQLGRS